MLVGGWPASGKTTLARALAVELGAPYLSKDEVKEALMDALGTPATVEESRRLLGPAVWELVRPDRPTPRGRDAPGISPSRLEAMLDVLEAL